MNKKSPEVLPGHVGYALAEERGISQSSLLVFYVYIFAILKEASSLIRDLICEAHL